MNNFTMIVEHLKINPINRLDSRNYQKSISKWSIININKLAFKFKEYIFFLSIDRSFIKNYQISNQNISQQMSYNLSTDCGLWHKETQ